MRIVFQKELSNLQQSLVYIAQLVERAISDATKAFTLSNLDLAENVYEYGAEITTACAALDEKAIDVLARQAPVASDLRLVVAALRISSSLERMGDLTEHIANLVQFRFPKRATPKGLKRKFKRMGALDVQIASLLVTALEEEGGKENGLSLQHFEDIDDEIDALHKAVFNKVLSEGEAFDNSRIVDATLASRYHERFGDHAVAIAKHLNTL